MYEKLLQLFSFLSKLEQSVQVRRKVLTDYYDYDASKIFKMLDIESKGFINSDKIIQFLDSHGIPYTNESVKLLIIFYDSDFDGELSFEEFIPLIQNNNILTNDKKVKLNLKNNTDISFNIEYCLTKIFEKEIEINQYIINLMTQIQKNIDNNLFYLFKEISLNKEYIRTEDIIYFLDTNKIDYTNNQINDIMKRLDINKDGKIDFNEFEYLFGLVKPQNKQHNSNYRLRPSNNYNNICNYKNNFENYGNKINESHSNEMTEDNRNNEIENTGYQNHLLDQNNSFCQCCFCPNNFYFIHNHKQNQINNNSFMKEQNYNANNNNNFINNNIEDLEYNRNFKYNPNNIYETNNNEYKDSEQNILSNNIQNPISNNNIYINNYNDINNIYNTKNYNYNDKNNEENNNNNFKKSYYNNDNTKIQNNKYKMNFSEKIKNNRNFLFHPLSPNKNDKISNSLCLRVSPIRKNIKNYKSKNNNLNNNSSYCYEQNNYRPINENNIKNTEIKDNNENINSNTNYNYSKLKRNHSQGNFAVDKNKLFQNNITFNSNQKLLLTKKKILQYFQLIMDGESQIELSKINLILRMDFEFQITFNLFDDQNKGYITFDDLKNELEFMGLGLPNIDVQLLMNRFNRSNEENNVIDYNDFCNVFLPNNPKYHNIKKDNEIKVFSPTTRLYFKGLIKAMAELENKLNRFKKENINYKRNNIIDFLKEIDFNEKGFFNKSDLINYLRENDSYSSLIDAELLFKRLDNKSKNKITYEDFLSDLKYL